MNILQTLINESLGNLQKGLRLPAIPYTIQIPKNASA